jgi:ABC-type phosphate/phosphonate transport system permease subunit
MWRKGRLNDGLRMAVKLALRSILVEIVVLGIFVGLLSQFERFREAGFKILSVEAQEKIRDVMKALFDSRSVRAVMEFCINVILSSMGLTLLLSFVGAFISKAFVFPQVLSCSRIKREKEENHAKKVDFPHVTRKIFLNYANLRI